jgi:hypothetical protein
MFMLIMMQNDTFIHLIEDPSHHEPSACFQEIFKEGWSCWLDGKKVTSNAELALQEFISGHCFHEHCHLKENLTPTEFNHIDWDEIRDATTTAPTLFNLWMTNDRILSRMTT